MTTSQLGHDDGLAQRLSRGFSWFQPVLAVAITGAVLAVGSLLASDGAKFLLYIGTGVCLGYVLVRGAFGFAGGVKRVYITGEGSLTNALIAMFTITTLVTLGIQWAQSQELVPMGPKGVFGIDNVYPVGLPLALGAFIFGVGAIMAGACASGCLTDIGEGYGRAMIAFVFFILFSVPGEIARAAIESSPLGAAEIPAVHLPSLLTYPGAMIACVIGYGIMYLLVWGYEQKRKREGHFEAVNTPPELRTLPSPADGRSDGATLYRFWHNLFCTRWSFLTSSVMLGILWIFVLVSTGKAWGVTSAFTTLDVQLLHLIGVDFDAEWASKANKAVAGGLINDGGTVRNIGIVLGALYCLLLAGRFRLDLTFRGRDTVYYAIGGALMGFGARLADGCNIGALFSGLSVGSLSGWVFGLFLVLGSALALKAFEGRINIIPPSRHVTSAEQPIPAHRVTDR